MIRSAVSFDAVGERDRLEIKQLHRPHRDSRRGQAGARDGGGAIIQRCATLRLWRVTACTLERAGIAKEPLSDILLWADNE